MRRILFFGLFGLTLSAWGNPFLQHVEATLKPENLKANYLKHDFSRVLMPQNRFLGFIGDDFQRLKISFKSVKKDPSRADGYIVQGTSEVKGNICDFTGSMRITDIRELKNMHFGLDHMTNTEGYKSQGVLIADYLLKENPKQKHVGFFKGKLVSRWYEDKNGLVKYDDIENFSDNYANNQYVGNWVSYANKANSKKANWGEYRIPDAGDLDIGAGEFGVNPKYKKNGWEMLYE